MWVRVPPTPPNFRRLNKMRVDEFLIGYGCYLEHVHLHVRVTHNFDDAESAAEALVKEYWDVAYEHVCGWYGMHGFKLYDEDYESEDEEDEAIEQFICENVDCWVDIWNDEEHSGYCDDTIEEITLP